ncbi:MAG: DUF1653 domain-containing protein [bacterium]
MKKIEIGAIYKHYKGTKVKILWEGFHSETLEPMIIYMHLEDGVVWVRPKKMFLEIIFIKSHVKGQTSIKVERFKKIKQNVLIKPSRK